LPIGRRRDVLYASGLGLALALFADGLARSPARAWPLAALLPVLAFLPPFDRRDRGVVRYIGLAVATVVVVHVVFFGEDRFQIVTTPALCVLAAAALRWADPEPSL
jgi:hypothetical protein